MAVLFDVVLRGGTVVDGTGAAGVRSDVAIDGERVVAIGDLSAAQARQDVDVTGQVVAPGLIDAHTHTDYNAYLPEDQQDLRLSGLRQGVTTEVCGNCGGSPFPVLDTNPDLGGLRALFGDDAQVFPSLAAYRKGMAQRRLANNLAPLLGHGQVRISVIGMEDRAATPDELDAMRRLVAEAMDDGAFGMSTGLIYAPGSFANTDEVATLASEVARAGRIYATHMRNESDEILPAIDEALEIGRRSGAAVQISHHKLSGEPNWGRSQETLRRIDDARAQGNDVMVDFYPYTAGSSHLGALLPVWALEGGGAEVFQRLKDRSTRDRIQADLDAGPPRNIRSALARSGWSNIVIAMAPGLDQYHGLSIPEVAKELGLGGLDTICELMVRAGGPVMMVAHTMSQADVDAIAEQPYAMVGSDGVPTPGKPHPRGAGTFALRLAAASAAGDPARLADGIHRMTGMTAARFGIPDRGQLRTGAVADIVVFDPATVGDRATYDDPLAAPVGINHVLLAGRFAVRDAVVVDDGAGTVLAPA